MCFKPVSYLFVFFFQVSADLIMCQIFTLLVMVLIGNFSACFFWFPYFIFIVTFIFTLSGFWPINTHSRGSVNHQLKTNSSTINSAVIIDYSINILDAPKFKDFSTWSYRSIPQLTYLAYYNEEKLRMFRDYYQKKFVNTLVVVRLFVSSTWSVWKYLCCFCQLVAWYFYWILLCK